MSNEDQSAGGRMQSEHSSEDAEGMSRDGEVASPVDPPAAEIATAGAVAPAAAGGAASQQRAKRARKAPIDIDEHIAAARKAMHEAQKQVSAARSQARNEKRKKQRLMKKAATLTSEDLERIAVWKRCGLDPTTGRPNALAASASSMPASASASSTPESSPAARPATSPAACAARDTTELRPPLGAAA